MTQNLMRIVRCWFAIDERSLAALRIALAIALLVDLGVRSTDLIAHYTDVGVLPRPARISIYEFRGDSSAQYWWSLHMAGGTGWFQAALFLTAAAFAVCLALGYRTRLATVASWVLLVSLHTRLPGVNQGGDILLRMLLFWSMFLPLGACASIDRWRATTSPPSSRSVLSLATAAVILQVVLMYWCAAYAKLDPVWMQDRSAVYYALHFDIYAKPLGIYLRQFPQICQWLTVGTVWLEWLGPLLVFVPWKNWLWRTIAVALFWTFHLGLALTLELGLFPYLSLVAWLVFLPAEFWDFLGRALQPWVRKFQDRRFLDSLAALARRVFTRPAARRFQLSLLGNALVAVALALAVYVNVASVCYPHGALPGPPLLDNLIALLRLEQQWLLFAPRPTRADGWFAMRGVLRDGSEVNLWHRDEPLATARPPEVRQQFPNHRWRKYMTHLCWDADREAISCFSDWLRWRWNLLHGDDQPQRQVREVQLVFYLEETPPPGQPPLPIREIILWHWDYENHRAVEPPHEPPAKPAA